MGASPTSLGTIRIKQAQPSALLQEVWEGGYSSPRLLKAHLGAHLLSGPGLGGGAAQAGASRPYSADSPQGETKDSSVSPALAQSLLRMYLLNRTDTRTSVLPLGILLPKGPCDCDIISLGISFFFCKVG